MAYAGGPPPGIPQEFDGVDSDNEEDVNDDEGTSKEDNVMENLRRQTLHGVAGPSRGITKQKDKRKSGINVEGMRDTFVSLTDSFHRFSDKVSSRTSGSVTEPSDLERVQDQLSELGLDMYPSYSLAALDFFYNNVGYCKLWLRMSNLFKIHFLTERVGPWPVAPDF